MKIMEGIKNIFKNTDGDQGSKGGIPWNPLSLNEEIDQILSRSENKPQVIYKHSTRCATSYFALKNLETLPDHKFEKADFHMVNVIKDRDLSQSIAKELSVVHESPQLLLLKNRKVVWDGSHQAVQSEILEERL